VPSTPRMGESVGKRACLFFTPPSLPSPLIPSYPCSPLHGDSVVQLTAFCGPACITLSHSLHALPCFIRSHLLHAHPCFIRSHSLHALPCFIRSHSLHALPCFTLSHSLHALPCFIRSHSLHALPCFTLSHSLHALPCFIRSHSLHALPCITLSHSLHALPCFIRSHSLHPLLANGLCCDSNVQFLRSRTRHVAGNQPQRYRVRCAQLHLHQRRHHRRWRRVVGRAGPCPNVTTDGLEGQQGVEKRRHQGSLRAPQLAVHDPSDSVSFR
jgi:hypothetical protein